MNPVERPPYRVVDQAADMAVEVEASDWPGLIAAATLALSDMIRPLGRFDTWTNRRVSVRGSNREDVLVAWLTEMLHLFAKGGFLPALAEVELSAETAASGILRGGCTDADEDPPDRVVNSVARHEVQVSPGRNGEPWRARIVLDV